MILVASLAVITVVAVIDPSSMTRQNKETSDKAAALKSAIAASATNHAGVRPAALKFLVVTDGAPCAMDNNPADGALYLTLQGWCGPYIDLRFKENPNDFQTDGWGVLFQYDSGTGFLTSCGPNRKCGDGDDLVFK